MTSKFTAIIRRIIKLYNLLVNSNLHNSQAPLWSTVKAGQVYMTFYPVLGTGHHHLSIPPLAGRFMEISICSSTWWEDKNGRPTVQRSTRFSKAELPCLPTGSRAPAQNQMMSPTCSSLYYLASLGLQVPNHEWCGQLRPCGHEPQGTSEVLPGVQHHRLANRHPALTYTFSKHVQMLFNKVQVNAKCYW